MPKTKVFAVRADRLGGRLSALVNAKRLADMFDLDLRVFWTKPKHAYPELVTPEDVFSEAFITDHFLPANTPKGALKFTPIPKKSIPCSRAEFAAKLSNGDVGFVTREGAVVLPFEDGDTARAGFAATFESLDFSAAFRATKDHIDSVLSSGANFIAIHIRRGDVIRRSNTAEGHWHGQYVPDIIYFQVLDNLYGPDVRFIFFCDDQEVLSKYQQRYEGSLAAVEMTATDGQPVLHIDLAEMYLMSRCTRIIGPRTSAFSTTAAHFSATTCEPVEDLLTPDEMRDAISQLVLDLKTGVSAFHGIGDYKQSLNALLTHHKHARPEMTACDIAKISRGHQTATTQILSTSLTDTLISEDLSAIPWLEEMLRDYDVRHISANGDSYAALAYAHFVQGDIGKCADYLVWANWFYPESFFGSYVSSALAGEVAHLVPYFDTNTYAGAQAVSPLPPHKELRFLKSGPLAHKIDKLGRMKNHFAPYMTMDWLEFVNLKTRYKLQMRSSLPHNLLANIPADFVPYNIAMSSGSKASIADLQQLAQTSQPLALKRLASAYFRTGKQDAGLAMMHEAAENSQGATAYLAALGIRLMEYGHPEKALEIFTQLDAPWVTKNPSVTYAHALALFGVKEYAKSAKTIQRNLEFAQSCQISNTLKRQLRPFL